MTSESAALAADTGQGPACWRRCGLVIADSRAIAKDAAELVAVEYEPGGAVTDVLEAAKPEAPLVHDEFPDNHCYRWLITTGDADRCSRTPRSDP